MHVKCIINSSNASFKPKRMSSGSSYSLGSKMEESTWKHFATSGEGNTSRRIAVAERIRDTLHYKNERAMQFFTFLDKLQKIFNIFSPQRAQGASWLGCVWDMRWVIPAPGLPAIEPILSGSEPYALLKSPTNINAMPSWRYIWSCCNKSC